MVVKIGVADLVMDGWTTKFVHKIEFSSIMRTKLNHFSLFINSDLCILLLFQEEHDDDGVNIGEAEPDKVAEILDQEADSYHPPNQEERMED